MKLSRLAVLPLLAIASPAFAKDDYLALVARLMGGLTDGGQAIIGTFDAGTVKMTAPGVFEITFETGAATFLYTEPDTCIFTQHSQMEGQPTSEARLDFTKVTGVDIQDQGEWDGLNAAVVTLNGPPETLQIMLGDKLVNQQPAFAFLASSITLEELQAAADELQRVC
jgi:hypothetical protein